MPAAAVELGCAVPVPEHGEPACGVAGRAAAHRPQRAGPGRGRGRGLGAGHRPGTDRRLARRRGPVPGSRSGRRHRPPSGARGGRGRRCSGPDGLRELPPEDRIAATRARLGASRRMGRRRRGGRRRSGRRARRSRSRRPGGRVLAFGGLPSGQAVVPIDVNRIHYQQLRLDRSLRRQPRAVPRGGALAEPFEPGPGPIRHHGRCRWSEPSRPSRGARRGSVSRRRSRSRTADGSS